MLGLIIFILAVAVIVVAVKVNTGGETGNVAGAGFDSTKTVNRNTNTGNPTVDYYRNKYKRMEQAGMKIDWWEFQKSVEKGWPYPVATEREREDICSFEHQALRGDAGSIIQLLFSYSHGSFEESNDSDLTIYKDEDKVHYWRNVLIQGAEQGNRNFQAALIGKVGINQGWISDDRRQLFRERYEERLLADAEAGDPQAMYAVADNLLGEASYGSEHRRVLAEKAALAGVGDAAYLCEEIYRLACYEKEKNGEPNPYEYSEKIRYYLMGVESNNGAMLGVMQDLVADAYRDGDAGLPKDLNKAIYYYRLAAQNGYEMAEHRLQTIEEHPELFK